MSDDDDDDDVKARARLTDPDTSHLAAERVDDESLQDRVYGFLLKTYPRPWAQIEVARNLNIHIWSISPRFAQLRKRGLIEPVGVRRILNSNGKMRPMLVWQVRKNETAAA